MNRFFCRPPPRRAFVAPVIAVFTLSGIVLTSCNGDSASPEQSGYATARDCGLPAAKATADPGLVPDEFLLDDPEVEVTETIKRRNRFIAALNVEGSVQDTFKAFKAALGRSAFDLLQEDNEGFEAELYLQRRDDFAVIQIRASNCDDASLVFLNLPPA